MSSIPSYSFCLLLPAGADPGVPELGQLQKDQRAEKQNSALLGPESSTSQEEQGHGGDVWCRGW